MATPLSSGAPLPSPLLPKPKWRVSKEVHFNHDLSVTKKLQAGVDLVADLVGVTLGPKGRNVLLQNPYGPPKIVNDGETVLKEVQLADPLANVGVKLVRQAGSKTNQLAGDGCTTAIVLARGLISEGVKVAATGINPVLLARGLDKTARALVSELRLMSREIQDHEIARVAAIASGNDREVGDMIADALRRVGGFGAVRIDKGRGTGNTLQVLEGMQFDRGYLSPYFATDRRNMVVEFENCKLLLVDGKITNAKDLLRILDSAVRENYPLLIVAENVEQDALAPVIRNKLKGALRAAAVKAPAFGERKSQFLDDIAVLTRTTVIRDAMGYSLEKVASEVLGSAAKVVVTKDSTLIVTDGRTREDVEKRVAQLRSLVENTDESFKKKLLIERIARLSTGIAVIQVGAQTEVELRDRKLRIEDALNAARAAIEEGVVVGGGCCMLRLSMKVDDIKSSLLNEEEKIGAEIFKKALAYPAKLIAENAGKNGSVVVEKILSSNDSSFGYNASKDCYEDLVSSGILDPTKVLRCCLEHASSVARTFLLSDVVVVDSEVSRPIPTRRRTLPNGTSPMLDRSQTMGGRFSGLGKSKFRF